MKKLLLITIFTIFANAEKTNKNEKFTNLINSQNKIKEQNDEVKKPIRLDIGEFGVIAINGDKQYKDHTSTFAIGGALFAKSQFDFPVQIFARATAEVEFLPNIGPWMAYNTSYGLRYEFEKVPVGINIGFNSGVENRKTYNLFAKGDEDAIPVKSYGLFIMVDYQFSQLSVNIGYNLNQVTKRNKIFVGTSWKMY